MLVDISINKPDNQTYGVDHHKFPGAYATP